MPQAHAGLTCSGSVNYALIQVLWVLQTGNARGSSSGEAASSEVSSTDAYDSNPTDVLEDINDSFASALALDAPKPPWWSLLPPSGELPSASVHKDKLSVCQLI